MKNPLAQYVEKLERKTDKLNAKGNPTASDVGAEQALLQVAHDLTVLLPQLENLITWQDGCPTEDGEYLVTTRGLEDGDDEHTIYGGKRANLFINFFGFFVPLERIRRHAKLKVG